MNVRFDPVPDKVTVVAQGPDADAAISALAPQIAQGLGEEGAPAPAPASRVVAEIARPAPAPRSDDPDRLLGVTASPGLAVGAVFQVHHQDLAVAQTADDPRAEERKLDAAIEQARRDLEAIQVQLHGQADADKAAIFAAHQEILDDPELLGLIELNRPVAVIASAILHHLLDEDDPIGVIRAFSTVTPPGSCLFVSHFRSSELLVLGEDGAVAQRVQPPTFHRQELVTEVLQAELTFAPDHKKTGACDNRGPQIDQRVGQFAE